MTARLAIRLLTAMVVGAVIAGAGGVMTLRRPDHDAAKLVPVARRAPPSTTASSVLSTEPPTTEPPTSGAPTTAAPTTVPPPAPVTAAAASAPVATPASLRGKVIVIDPGHNGANWAHPDQINQLVPAGGFSKACDTTGTVNTTGYPESAFNFDVAVRLQQDLQRLGATVFLTRANDTGWGPCVNERAAIGNRAHADAAISIHADGAPTTGHGFDVIQPAVDHGYNDGMVAPSDQLAIAVRDSFARATAMPVANYAGIGGIDTRSDLGGLNLSAVPKVFVECGNMRNPSDSTLQSDPAWRQRAADGLALAFTSFLGR